MPIGPESVLRTERLPVPVLDPDTATERVARTGKNPSSSDECSARPPEVRRPAMARRIRFRSTMRPSLDGAGWVLQQLADPVRALDEMVCVTRPCGRVVVADLDQESLVIEVPGVPADLVTG